MVNTKNSNADGHPYGLRVVINYTVDVAVMFYDKSRRCSVPILGTDRTCNQLAHYNVDDKVYCRRHASEKVLDLVLEHGPI